MITRTVTITTDDTGKVYKIPLKGIQLWEIRMSIHAFDNETGIISSSLKTVTKHVERQTLVDVGLLPQARDDDPPPAIRPTIDNFLIYVFV